MDKLIRETINPFGHQDNPDWDTLTCCKYPETISHTIGILSNYAETMMKARHLVYLDPLLMSKQQGTGAALSSALFTCRRERSSPDLKANKGGDLSAAQPLPTTTTLPPQ